MIKIFLIAFLLLQVTFPANVFANETTGDCGNRYVTFVNPVRGRQLWEDQSLKPFLDQSAELSKRNYAGTWLLQYDTFFDSELTKELKHLPNNQERGLFLEISKKLAQDSKVYFDSNEPWFSPKVVFLSSYERSERRRLIDLYYSKFKEIFGYYPASVGAWWIDSYSLEYIKDKYGLKSVMIVADQLSTDRYGVWGQWWGVPYYPQKQNLLLPANVNNNLDVVVIQWAQRHPEKAYGDSPAYSNYSLQANDYTRLGLNHQHFTDLVNFYLDCSLPLGQVTIGLETGQESVQFFKEYQNQLETLSKIPGLQALTMSEFSERFKISNPGIAWRINLKSDQSVWQLSTNRRENSFLKDKINYSQVSFSDYYKADKSGFLDRNLVKLDIKNYFYYPLYLWIIFLFGYLYYVNKKIIYFLSLSLLFFGLYGLLYKSYYQFGWEIYYGPIFSDIIIWQSLVAVAFFSVFWVLRRIRNIETYVNLVILTLGIQSLIGVFRYTVFDGKKVLGISFDNFQVIGVTVDKSFSPGLFSYSFPAEIARALYHFPIENYRSGIIYYMVLIPLFHFILGVGLLFILKKIPKNGRFVIYGVLGTLTIFYFYQLINADPLRVVAPR